MSLPRIGPSRRVSGYHPNAHLRRMTVEMAGHAGRGLLLRQHCDPTVPNVARIYDFLLGGNDNFVVDREAATKLLEAAPGAAVAARENRAFLARAVRFLAEEAGICQFLDVGAGLPTACAVHEIVRGAVPMSRVVYADYDREVVRHAEAVLGDSLTTAVVRADVRQPWDLFSRPTVRTLINLAEPLAILLVAVLHFIEDHEDPWAIVNCYKDLMAPGSYLVVSHVTADYLSVAAAHQAHAVYEGASAPSAARSRGQVARFFAGLDMLAPGLVEVSGWRPDVIGPSPEPALFYAGIGRKSVPGRPR